MAEINFRKKKLKDDLDKLESGFKERADKVKSIIPVSMNPVDSIRKHPFRAFGIAIASGLLFGLSSRNKRSQSDNEAINNHSSQSSGFSSLLISELKRLAAHRAASYISEMIANKSNQNRR